MVLIGLSSSSSPSSVAVGRARQRPPPLNLVRENAFRTRWRARGGGGRRVYRWRFGNSARAEPGSAFNDRAIGQLSSIIIALIRISYATDRVFRSLARVFIYRNFDSLPRHLGNRSVHVYPWRNRHHEPPMLGRAGGCARLRAAHVAVDRVPTKSLLS